jgi:hypothetical protein
MTEERLLLIDLVRRALTLHKRIGKLMTGHADKFDWKVIEIIDAASFKALEAHQHLKKAFDKTYFDKTDKEHNDVATD